MRSLIRSHYSQGLWLFLVLMSPVMGEPAATLSEQEQDVMVVGRSFFNIPWVAAPSSTTARDGLGPLFNANTCASCHTTTPIGRPLVDEQGKPDRRLVLKLSQMLKHDERKPTQITLPDPVYGMQIAINGINGVPNEASPILRARYTPFTWADGEQMQLRHWQVDLRQLNYGPLDVDTRVSVRIAPLLIGLGQLEAMTEADLQKIQADQQVHHPSMVGAINPIYDALSQEFTFGRFGWKSGQASLQSQSADAAINDMGLTNSAFPDESCTKAQSACQQAPRGRQINQSDVFDLPSHRLGAMAFYVAKLPMPAPKPGGDAQKIRLGEQLFNQMQCAVCHRAEPIQSAANAVAPYSDFLLHDLGAELADQRPEFGANVNQWRTAPLWRNYLKREIGMGFLHDGRARTLLEAIAWHGGQATPSRQAFTQLNSSQREALIEFLESL